MHHQKSLSQKADLLEGVAALKCSGGVIGFSSTWVGGGRFTSPDFSFEARGFYHRVLSRTLFIEKGAMP